MYGRFVHNVEEQMQIREPVWKLWREDNTLPDEEEDQLKNIRDYKAMTFLIKNIMNEHDTSLLPPKLKHKIDVYQSFDTDDPVETSLLEDELRHYFEINSPQVFEDEIFSFEETDPFTLCHAKEHADASEPILYCREQEYFDVDMNYYEFYPKVNYTDQGFNCYYTDKHIPPIVLKKKRKRRNCNSVSSEY